MTQRFLKVFKDTNLSNKGFRRFPKDASFGPNDVRYEGFAHVFGWIFVFWVSFRSLACIFINLFLLSPLTNLFFLQLFHFIFYLVLYPQCENIHSSAQYVIPLQLLFLA